MGRRDRGPGTARRMKERQLGIEISGLTKPMLDASNVESKRLYGLGIGVLVQEEDRSRRICESLAGRSWNPGRVLARRRARAEWRVWEARLRRVSEVVAEHHRPR